MPLSHLDTQQKDAATSKGLEIAVSAGAGSGKTRLLVGRYLYLLMSQGAGMHEIAAITFTEKAAAQMKTAIARKASALAEETDPRTAFWADVAVNVYSAPVSTIHAFCNGILRNYPAEAACDPAFTILDDASRVSLLDEAVNRHVQECLDTEPELMEHLLAAFGLSRLKRIYRSVLNNRISLLTWIDTCEDVSEEAFDRNCTAYVANRLRSCAGMMKNFHALAPGEDKLGELLLSSIPETVYTADLIEAGKAGSDSLRDFAASLASGMKKGSSAQWREAGTTIGEARKPLKDISGLMTAYANYLEKERGSVPATSVLLIRECLRLEQRFLEMKKRRSAFDHDDTLIETWRLLRNNPAVCKKLSQTYRYFLVDEFQDTDSLQMDILKMIAGDSAASLFTVGDPKQSIYRFRGADVAVFNEFVAGTNVEFKTLKMNYRSTPGVIAFINRVFSAIMGQGGGAGYEAEYSDMKARERSDFLPVPVEIVVVEGENADSVRRIEAERIAAKIAKLNEQNGIDFGDMAVLFRKGTVTRVYEEAFLAHSIPYINMTTGRLSDYPEIHDIANLTGWLCEPGDAALFASVLISPFFMVSREDLAGIRLLARSESSMAEEFLCDDSIASHEWFASSGLRQVRAVMLDLIEMRDRCSVRDILEHVFALSGYTMQVLADPVRGELAMSVLDRVLQSAESFESNGGDIYQFARQLREETIFSELSPSLESESRAVNLLTIHKSKGLEYRAVFVADAASRPAGGSPDIGFHDSLGPAFKLREPGGDYSDTLSSAFLAEEDGRKDIAESKRLFYVACTRAEDYLMVIGGKPSKEIDVHYEKGNWMGWLHAALGIDSSGEERGDGDGSLYTYERVVDGATAQTLSMRDFWAPFTSFIPDSQPPEEDCSGILRAIELPPAIAMHGPPRHLSPTQALDYLACPAMYLYRHVWSLDMRGGEGGGFGMRYGSFAHSALELFDYDIVSRPENERRESVEALVKHVTQNDTPEKWRSRLVDELLSFAGSGLARSVAGAESIRREEPFCFLRDTVLIRGSMDVMFRTGERIGIVDFKTDSVDAADIHEHSERYVLQLGLYALAVERAAFAIPEKLALYYLSPGAEYEVDCSRAFLDDISSRLSGIIASMASGDYSPRHSSHCEDCPYHALCG